MNPDNQHQEKQTCQVCGKQYEHSFLYPAELVRPHLVQFIKKRIPDWDNHGYICTDDLHKVRADYIESIINKEIGETRHLEKEFVRSIKQHELISENIDEKYEASITFGDKLSDRMASFGGSWRFIIFFTIILIVWIAINSIALLTKPFDPFPFILLNLILSCLAAIQAPVIMMSQNRQEAKDRMRSKHDYKINLKAELEIRLLNEKIDFLLAKQWHQLLEIQGIQTEIIEEILKKDKE